MTIPWKNGLIGLATGAVLAAILAGTLASRHAVASQPGAASPQSRAVATPGVFRHRTTWVDDAGGTVPNPAITPVPPCSPDDLSLSVEPDRSSYNSADTVTFLFDARFKGVRTCRVTTMCFPEITVWDANGGKVWSTFGEVAGGACAGTPPALLSKPSQHLPVIEQWRQDDCGTFCNETKRSQAAPAGQYTATGTWRELGTSPPSRAFTLR
ncbi:MAG TPA: hypothetical protein VN193_09805 [Candidatus Angelobacter sp.]|jgi:hypothetical protein|nr:hypothetical protein [Candidatus Angelobacter sp.]